MVTNNRKQQDVKCSFLWCDSGSSLKAEDLSVSEKSGNDLAETVVTSAERLRCHYSIATRGLYAPPS